MKIAKSKVDTLKGKHTKKVQIERQIAFDKAKKFIDIASKNGGVSAQVSKTFMVNKRSRDKRVDIEVIQGDAFIT